MGRLAVLIELSEKERGELEGLSRRRRTAQGLAQRAQIVLLAADGLENKAIAERAGAVENTVGKWRRRFAEKRLDGLLDEPRPGRPREIGDDEIAETVRLTLETTPKDATHWSLRSMAACSRTARKASSFRPIPCSWRRCATLSDSTWRRLSMRWSCALTRRAISRRSTAASRCCRCARVRSSGAVTTIRAMA